MNRDLPLVSICVPSFNSASYIRESLDSIRAQTYSHIEIIVSDNASTDATPSILEEYARQYGIRVLLNDNNVGPGNNFNRLVSAAKGEYTAIYHADDLYEPTIVEESVRAFLADSRVGLVGAMARTIDASGSALYPYRLPPLHGGQQPGSFDEAMLGVLRTAGRDIFFVTPSIMVKSRLYRELGNFDQDSFKSSVDYEMWLRIAAVSSVAIIDRPLMRYRLHDKQGSELEVRKNVELPDIYFVIQAYRNRIRNASVRKICDATLDRTVFKTALKQNYMRRFTQSTETLQLLKTYSYRVSGAVLRAANAVRCSCRVWPGAGRK